ncbi:transporter [Streptomyces zagrosensis]|uniref:ABC-2 type transport system permease protein n=1 Tax=Streptomyces zagrosensis TaxID=1042984 RepID=A0A7W9UYE1_9ACTN|nr:transporter [Streptomyces zagrosensis]MBB5934709.1 ABC-2 type transport system permease protein [Streptomyces zagrosensis]
MSPQQNPSGTAAHSDPPAVPNPAPSPAGVTAAGIAAAGVTAASAPPVVSSPPAPPSTGALTAVFVTLKLSLLRNGLRQSSGRRFAYISSIVLVGLFAVLQLLGLVALRGHEHAAALVVMLAGVVALGWAVMPLFFPGGDETLDATRLVMLPLRPGALVVALLVSSLVGIGPLFTLTLAVGSVIAIAHGAAATAVAVLAVLLTMLVCVALARAVATANIRLLTSRKGRDLALLSGLFIAIGAQAVNLGTQKLSGAGGLSSLEPVADVLRWVPPCAAVDAVWSASDGAYGIAAAQLALTAALLAGLMWSWQRGLTTLMTSPDSSTLQVVEERTGRPGTPGLVRLLPAGRTGTVMLRTLRYAWRDPKTKAGWATSLGIGLLLPVVTVAQGNGSVYAACWAAGLLGLQMYNQFGQDTSAFWMVAQTIDTPRAAYLELRGRALALALVALPYVTVVVLGSAALMDDWAAFPGTLGLSLALLGALLATGAVASARYPYSIPQDSGYKNVVPGQTGLATLSVIGGMLVGALLCAPLLALTMWLHLAGHHGLLWLILPAGAAYSLALAQAGLRLAAPYTASHLPEILTAVSKG